MGLSLSYNLTVLTHWQSFSNKAKAGPEKAEVLLNGSSLDLASVIAVARCFNGQTSDCGHC